MDAIIKSLEQFERDAGQLLPMPAQQIAQLEQAGHMVDLETGVILWGGSTEPLVDTDPDESAVAEALEHLAEVGLI